MAILIHPRKGSQQESCALLITCLQVVTSLLVSPVSGVMVLLVTVPRAALPPTSTPSEGSVELSPWTVTQRGKTAL